MVDMMVDVRQTVLDWNGQLMGPICDEQGLEQGGVSSSEFYKIFGREQLSTTQASTLGVSLGSTLTVSGIGQADDTALVSNGIHGLLSFPPHKYFLQQIPGQHLPRKDKITSISY